MKYTLLPLLIFALNSCTPAPEDHSLDEVKWDIYQCLYTETDAHPSSPRYTKEVYLLDCQDFDHSAVYQTPRTNLQNYLQLGILLLPYYLAKKSDTLTYFILFQYNEQCIMPTKPLEIPTEISVYKDKFVFIKTGSMIFNSDNWKREKGNFEEFMRKNKSTLHPWLYREAKRRGVFDKQ